MPTRKSNPTLQYSPELEPYVNELCELMNCNRRTMTDTLIIMALAESETVKKQAPASHHEIFQNKARQAGRALAKLKQQIQEALNASPVR